MLHLGKLARIIENETDAEWLGIDDLEENLLHVPYTGGGFYDSVTFDLAGLIEEMIAAPIAELLIGVLRDPAHHATNIAVFAGTKFEIPGVYNIEVVVDDVMKLRYPIPVVVVKPPPGAKKRSEEDPEAPKENI